MSTHICEWLTALFGYSWIIVFYLFIILFCLFTIITLAQAAKLMKLHKNIIPFTIKHYFKFHNKSYIFFSHQYIYQQYTLYKYMLLHTACINILYKKRDRTTTKRSWITFDIPNARVVILYINHVTLFCSLFIPRYRQF